MLAHAPKLPSLDPLIAEARRRAKQRRVLLAGAAIVLAAGAALVGMLVSGTSYAATRPLSAALARAPLGAAIEPAFAPGATFGESIVLTNKAGAPILLDDVRAVLRPTSPLRQVGTRLTAFKLEQCPGGCPPGYPRYVSPPYGAVRPVSLGVGPGGQALAQLNFRFVRCWNKPLPWRPVVRRVTVRYRTPDGTAIDQRIALGGYSIAVMGMNTSRCHR